MKVYGGLVYDTESRRQVRTIVAAKSIAAAVRALHDADHHITRYEFTRFWGETGNDVEIQVASGTPGTVFAARGLDSSAQHLPEHFTPLKGADS